MANIYEMSVAGEQLLELLENGDIDEQVFHDTLEAMGADEKIENYCKVIKQLISNKEMYGNEINRLTERKKTTENSITRMKEALLNFMQSTKQNKVKAGLFSVSTRTSRAVEILDEKAIPEVCLIPQPPKPDKTLIKQMIETGVSVNGAVISERVSVIIR